VTNQDKSDAALIVILCAIWIAVLYWLVGVQVDAINYAERWQ
jgi:hypothetical protein